MILKNKIWKRMEKNRFFLFYIILGGKCGKDLDAYLSYDF